MSYYFHKADWTITTNPERGVRIATPLVFTVVPVLGACFLMFLPVIGFVLLGQAVVQKGLDLAKGAAANSLPIGMVPGEAHLVGSPGEGKAEKDPQDKKLEQLEREIASKRATK